MIHGLHHVAISVNDIEAAVRDYETLLGTKVTWRGAASDGNEAWFALPNLWLALAGPTKRDPHSAKLRDQQGAQDGISRIAFAVGDIEKAHRLVSQRAISTEPLQTEDFGNTRRPAAWLSATATHGIRIGLVEADQKEEGPPRGHDGLDHLVVSTPDPERAIVLYGGRLGLDLRLDRNNPDWDARLLFFRCGDLIIEIAHRLSGGRGEGNDRFMGLSWRVPDMEKTHTRLAKEGFNLSEIRKGRRPGTRVFTVRDRTGAVPTIFVGPDSRGEAA